MNKDKYQYLDSSLKHAQNYTHTCLMVLHTNVQQLPGSHFAVVDSGTSMLIFQATFPKTTQPFPDSAETQVEQPAEATSTAWCEHKPED